MYHVALPIILFVLVLTLIFIVVVFLFSVKISPRTSGYKYMFNSSDVKFSTSKFRNRVPLLKLTLKTEYVLPFCVWSFLLYYMILFWEITHYATCVLYSPVFMEVVCSAKASKHKRCLNNKVFHIFQIKSPKVIHLCFLEWERTGGGTHTSWFFENTYAGKLA